MYNFVARGLTCFSHCVEVDENTTIREVKEKIEEKYGTYVRYQHIISREPGVGELEDDRTLGSYGLTTDYCVTSLVLRIPDGERLDAESKTETESKTESKTESSTTEATNPS